MPLPSDLPIVDHHCHLSDTESALGASRRFRKAGGTHLFLATQSYSPKPPTSLAEYRDQFETTLAIARRVETATGVVVYTVVAPHPTDLVGAVASIGLPEATRIQEAALELAGRLYAEQRIVALGEVGFPHFPVSSEVAEAAASVFRRALEVARDAGCPVVVHSEDLDSEGYRALADRAARSEFPVRRLVKHFARSIVPTGGSSGVVPSYLAGRELAIASLQTPQPWFWETDYLDDPRRPGAVLDLATVPRRAARAAAAGPEAIEALRIPFETSVRSVYGFEPRVAESGPR